MQKDNTIQFRYSEKIAQLFQVSPSDIFLYRKGRIGLYVLLRALNVKPGDEIILSGYSCSAIAHTILSFGAKPVYADIRKDTFTIDLNSVKTLWTDKTRIIISQNTFGISFGIEEIDKWAHDNEIIHIEDCAHGFGGLYNNKTNGRICDAAFYSTHFCKPLNTGIGGVLIVNNLTIKKRVISVNTQINEAPLTDSILLPILYYWQEHKYLYHISNYAWKLYSLYKRVFKNCSDYNFMRERISFASAKQLNRGLSKIESIPLLNLKRKQHAEIYSRYLKDRQKIYVSDGLKNNHLFLYYPILVKDKQKVLLLAKQAGIDVNGIFTIKHHPELLGIDYSKLPVTVYISDHLINLPTNPSSIYNIIQFLDDIGEEIL